MNQTVKTLLGALVIFTVGCACGYFALPAKVVTKTEVKTVIQVVKDTTQDKQDHVKVVTVVVRQKDGSTTTTTTKTQDSDTKTDTDTKINKDQDATSSKEVTYSKNALSLNLLMADKIG